MNTDIVSLQIKQSLTMPDMLRHYGFETNSKRRIQCPIHSGHDKNFSYNDKAFRCWVCDASGDVISFVMQLFSLDFKQALQRINYDFLLGLSFGVRPTVKERRESQRLAAELKRRQAANRAEAQRISSQYWNAFDEWQRLDRQLKSNVPKTPDGEVNPLFFEALQKIGFAEHQMECAAAERCAYEQGADTRI